LLSLSIDGAERCCPLTLRGLIVPCSPGGFHRRLPSWEDAPMYPESRFGWSADGVGAPGPVLAPSRVGGVPRWCGSSGLLAVGRPGIPPFAPGHSPAPSVHVALGVGGAVCVRTVSGGAGPGEVTGREHPHRGGRVLTLAP